METALRYELIQAVSELNNLIYPTNAPEAIPKNADGTPKPYVVYTRISTKPVKTLEGYTNKEALSYMFSIMAVKYSDMVRIRKLVKELLVGMAQREIGSLTKFFVEDININNIDEQYEHELGINRGIIDFTIYY